MTKRTKVRYELIEQARRLLHTPSKLLLIHWGCVDAPEYTPFNGDPERLEAAVKNPERVYALALGEGLSL